MPPSEARPIPRAERIKLNLVVMLLYVGLIAGGVIGWRLADSFWGVFVGLLLGWLAGALLGLLVMGLWTLVLRLRE